MFLELVHEQSVVLLAAGFHSLPVGKLASYHNVDDLVDHKHDVVNKKESEPNPAHSEVEGGLGFRHRVQIAVERTGEHIQVQVAQEY